MRNLLLVPCFLGIAVAQDGDHGDVGARGETRISPSQISYKNIINKELTQSEKAESAALSTGRIGDTLRVPEQFASITAAVQAAIEGQTVYVRAGTYAEDIRMKAGVRLAGAAGGGTVIEGTVTIANAAGVRLSRLDIRGQNGIYISNSPDVAVRTCRVSGAVWGVAIHGCAPLLHNNRLEGNTYGIYLGDSAGSGLEIRQNLIADNDIGILARSTVTLSGGENSLRGNRLYDLEATAGSGYLLAPDNWWGESPPDPEQIRAANGVYYSGYLTEDPLADVAAAQVPTAPRRALVRPPLSETEERARTGYAEARRRFENGQGQRAARLYGVLIERFPHSPLAAVALKDLIGLYHRMDQPHRARSLLRRIEPPLERQAKRLAFDLYLLEGRYDRALKLGEELLRQWPASPEAEAVALQMARVEALDRRDAASREAVRAFLVVHPHQADNRDRQIHRRLAQALLDEPPKNWETTRQETPLASTLPPSAALPPHSELSP